MSLNYSSRKKAETARWLAHSNLWGTLSTTSVHLGGRAWGQPKSFVDGPENDSTGTPYFYDRLAAFKRMCFTSLLKTFTITAIPA